MLYEVITKRIRCMISTNPNNKCKDKEKSNNNKHQPTQIYGLGRKRVRIPHLLSKFQDVVKSSNGIYD